MFVCSQLCLTGSLLSDILTDIAQEGLLQPLLPFMGGPRPSGRDNSHCERDRDCFELESGHDFSSTFAASGFEPIKQQGPNRGKLNEANGTASRGDTLRGSMNIDKSTKR